MEPWYLTSVLTALRAFVHAVRMADFTFLQKSTSFNISSESSQVWSARRASWPRYFVSGEVRGRRCDGTHLDQLKTEAFAFVCSKVR